MVSSSKLPGKINIDNLERILALDRPVDEGPKVVGSASGCVWTDTRRLALVDAHLHPRPQENDLIIGPMDRLAGAQIERFITPDLVHHFLLHLN